MAEARALTASPLWHGKDRKPGAGRGDLQLTRQVGVVAKPCALIGAPPQRVVGAAAGVPERKPGANPVHRPQVVRPLRSQVVRRRIPAAGFRVSGNQVTKSRV